MIRKPFGEEYLHKQHYKNLNWCAGKIQAGNGDFYRFNTNIYETLNFLIKMIFNHIWLKADVVLNTWWFWKSIIVFMQLHCIVY